MPALLLFVILFWPTPSTATVVDRIVAQVDDQLVLQSEAGLEEVLAGIDSLDTPFWDAGHKTPIERLVDAAIVRLAAGDIEIYQPEATALKARREAVRSRFASEDDWVAFLNRNGHTPQTFDTVLRRRMVVELYLGRNNQADRADSSLWLQACDALVDQLRERSRVRMIEPRGAP